MHPTPTVPSTVELVFPEPMQTLIYVYSFLEVGYCALGRQRITTTTTVAVRTSHLPLLTQVDIWGGLGADCYADGFDYMTRAYATSAIPIAVVLVIWCVWGLRRLCTSSGQTERRANIFSQHVQASLLLSYLVFVTKTTRMSGIWQSLSFASPLVASP